MNDLSIKVKVFNNQEVMFKEIDGLIYANANSMTDSNTIKNWKSSPVTKRYLEAIGKSYPSVEIIISSKGGVDNGGTWIHEKLVLSLARYISVEFEIWCDEQITTLLREGEVRTAKPALTIDMMIEAYQQTKLELNEAIKTKAYISDKKTATALATASKAVRAKNKLQKELDNIKDEDYLPVLRVMILNNKKTSVGISTKKLITKSKELNLDIKSIPDPKFGHVNKYHIDVWHSVYGNKFKLN